MGKKHMLQKPRVEKKDTDDGRSFFFWSGEGSIKQFLSDNLHFLFKIVVEDI